jgi:hypothetical protein
MHWRIRLMPTLPLGEQATLVQRSARAVDVILAAQVAGQFPFEARSCMAQEIVVEDAAGDLALKDDDGQPDNTKHTTAE